MAKYYVQINQICIFEDVEADSPEEAKRIVTEDYIWDDHLVAVQFDIEEELE